MNKNKVVLIGIFILAVFLRFYKLDVNPPSLTWDEASWGINAYSIGLSGKDEFGKFFPLTYLESFGDFKPPLYAYLTVIPIWIFGLNEFSVRFMSAFLGSLTVLFTFFLTKEIFYSLKGKDIIAILSSFLLAISPWHILLSRAAFEANIATFFIVLGTYLFISSTKNLTNLKFLMFSFLSFVAAMYTFNTSRVFLPLFVLFLIFLKRKMLLKHWKITLLSIIIPFIILLPLVLFIMTPQAQLRYKEVNIFSDISVIERTNQQMENSGYNLISKIIYNRRFAYAVEYISHYLDHFNPKFLFITGDGNPKFSIQDVGQMYMWELPFLIIGGLMLFRRKDGIWIMLPSWILLGIIPAATARETPHALRIETVLPSLQIITGYGIFLSADFLNKKIKSLYIKRSIWLTSGIIFSFFFVYFLHNYFNHYPITYASEWQYGYKEAIKFTESIKNKYERIYFTQDLGRPYVYLLFYGKYPIDVLQKDADVARDYFGFVHVERVGKYYFPKILSYPHLNSLFVNVPDKLPEQANIIKIIYKPNKKPALVIYE